MTIFGIIGGSGLYNWDELTIIKEHTIETPFGATSAPIIEGELANKKCFFIARHGTHHTILPHEVPYRANIFALKQLGVSYLFSVSAVGSLQEEITPGDLVVPDQYIDLTRDRKKTFFGNGIVAHVAFAHPTCRTTERIITSNREKFPFKIHIGGTYLCIEGPHFSTRAESHLYRSWKASVIGMTNMPEAKLAREAEIHYSTLAFPSDYDCWREEEEHVSVDNILETLKQNSEKAKTLIATLIKTWPDKNEIICDCEQALHQAIMTPFKKIPTTGKDLLSVLAPDLTI